MCTLTKKVIWSGKEKEIGQTGQITKGRIPESTENQS